MGRKDCLWHFDWGSYNSNLAAEAQKNTLAQTFRFGIKLNSTALDL